MGEDTIKREKMDVLYETAEIEEAIGCIESKLLEAGQVFADLEKSLPALARPSKMTVPGLKAGAIKPFLGLPKGGYPSHEELRTMVDDLKEARQKLRQLHERRAKLYPSIFGSARSPAPGDP